MSRPIKVALVLAWLVCACELNINPQPLPPSDLGIGQTADAGVGDAERGGAVDVTPPSPNDAGSNADAPGPSGDSGDAGDAADSSDDSPGDSPVDSPPE